MTRSLRTAQYLAFTALGLAQVIVGPLLPTLRQEIPMSDWRAGLFGSSQFIGVLAASLVGGHLADRFGKKSFVLAASALLLVGLLGYTVAGTYWPLLVAAIVAGLGSGGYEVGVNALQADHAGAADSGHGMSVLHAFYGIGAVIGAVAVEVTLRGETGWRPAIWLLSALPVAVAALLVPQRIAAAGKAATGPGPAGQPPRPEERGGRLYRQPTLWLCGMVFLAYVGVEMSVSLWIPTYWARRAGESAMPAPLMTAVFWGTLTVVRFGSGKLADRMGHVRFLVLSAGTVVILGGLWSIWSGPAFTLAAVVAIGAALAGVYPTAMAFATDRFPGQSGHVVAFLSIFVALGGFLLPSALGRLSDSFGIGVLPVLVVTTGAVLLAFTASLRAPRGAANDGPKVTPGSP